MRFALIERFRGSISLRIAILFSVTFTVGIALVFFLTYLQIGSSLETSSKSVISAKLRESALVLERDGLVGLKKFLELERNKVVAAPFMVRVLSPTGETLFFKPSVQEEAFDFVNLSQQKVAPSSIVGWHALSAIGDEDKFDILTESVGPELFLQVGRSSEDREEILDEISQVFVVSGSLLILLSAGLGIWYARKSLAPVRALLTTVREIQAGDLTRRVQVGASRDELRDLGETFNRMIARVEKLILIMRESLDNVAHDIRTPLTRIRAVAEDALLSKNPDALRGALEDCAESSTDISDLVDQLMSISEAEAGTLALNLENCDVDLLLNDVAEIYEFVAQDKEISLTVLPVPSGLTWTLDRKRMKQAVGNLVDNALKFSPIDSAVFISATQAAGRLVISVKDEGPGVATADLTRIWDRLYRADRSRTTKGLGLGLSIVRSIVMAHAGEVRAMSAPEGGMNFSISLPETPLTQFIGRELANR